jgi:protein-tyrosine phosphatase
VNTSRRFTTDVSQVAPHLWVGAAPDNIDPAVGAGQVDLLVEQASLGLVIDCRLGADDHALWAHHSGVRYVNTGVEDSGRPLRDSFFTEGVEAVLEHRARHPEQGVLIHCQSGHHRSPALALAVMRFHYCSFDAAIAQLVTARPVVSDLYFPSATRWWQHYSGEAS